MCSSRVTMLFFGRRSQLLSDTCKCGSRVRWAILGSIVFNYAAHCHRERASLFIARCVRPGVATVAKRCGSSRPGSKLERGVAGRSSDHDLLAVRALTYTTRAPLAELRESGSEIGPGGRMRQPNQTDTKDQIVVKPVVLTYRVSSRLARVSESRDRSATH